MLSAIFSSCQARADPISRYAATLMTDLAPQHGLSFADLYDRDGLVRLDRAFVAHLAAADVALHDRLMAARRDPDAIERQAESDLLVDLAPSSRRFYRRAVWHRGRGAGAAGASS